MYQFKIASRAFSRLPTTLRLALGATLGLTFVLPGHGQAAAAPAPDVIIFNNGDQLTGKLLREVAGSVTFHSDIAGDVSVTWDKIKSIHSSQQFAVIQQGQHVTRKTPDADVAQGVVQVQNDQVQVATGTGGTTKDIPVKNAAYIIDEATYGKEVRRNPGLGYGWTGAITAGASTVEATQNSRAFNGGIALARTIPTVNWLDPRTRILIDFTGAYGTVSQPGTPTVKTNIIHFDHNYSQGLDLQHIYGGGLGYTVVKTPQQELDVKFDIHYERQQFFLLPNIPPPVSPSKDLIGADIGDTYMLKLPKGMIFNQAATITPAFNQSNAYSAVASAGLLFPVYKRLGFSVGALDDFLNDPAAGSKKNSFQFTGGVTYTLK
jgi:hypothetical protein